MGSYTTYNTSTVTTNASGYVGNTYVYGRSTSTISTPQTHTFTYKTTYKKIYLDFACLDTNKQIEHIWEGFASAKINDWNDYPEKMVDNLIALIGEEDYKGYLRISGNQNVEKFVRSKKRKNILLLNADIGSGLLSGQMNDRISLSQYGYYDDIVGVGEDLQIPLNLRVGYLRELKKRYYIGASMIYSKNIPLLEMDIDAAGEYESGKTFYGSLNTAKVKSQQIGVELMALLKEWLLGVGLSKDIGSSFSFPVNGIDIVKNVDSLYMPVRLGYLWEDSASHFGLSLEFAGTIPLSGEHYIYNAFSMNMGLFYKIHLW